MTDIDPLTLLSEMDTAVSIPADVDRRIRREMEAALLVREPVSIQQRAELLELVPSASHDALRWNRRVLGVAASVLVLLLAFVAMNLDEPAEELAADASPAPPAFLLVCSEFVQRVTVDGQPWSSPEAEADTRLTVEERTVLLDQLEVVRAHPVAEPARESIDQTIAAITNDPDRRFELIEEALREVALELKEGTGIFCLRPG